MGGVWQHLTCSYLIRKAGGHSPWPSSPQPGLSTPTFSLWTVGSTPLFLGGTTCLPLPSFSCWCISVLPRRRGNNPLPSRPFLYLHDPVRERIQKTVRGWGGKDCQSSCWDMHNADSPVACREGVEVTARVKRARKIRYTYDLYCLSGRGCVAQPLGAQCLLPDSFQLQLPH